MERAVSLQEVLEIIFDFSDSVTNQANARVCRIWNAASIPVLWSTVSTPRHLFSALSPVMTKYTPTSDEVYQFKNHPKQEDWTRFRRYSILIHRVAFSGEDLLPYRPVITVFMKTKPADELFPNVRCLSIKGISQKALLSCAVFLLPPNATSFTMHFGGSYRAFNSGLDDETNDTGPETHQEQLGTYLDYVSRRMPNLTEVELGSCGWTNSDELTVVHKFIESLTKVSSLVLPHDLVRSETLRVASALPKLSSFQTLRAAHCYYDSKKNFSSSIRLDSTSFDFLHSLDLSAPFTTIINILRSLPEWRITTLRARTYKVVKPEKMLILTTTISEHCRYVTGLTLESLGQPVSDPVSPFIEQQISLTELNPILALHDLKDFSVIHHLPLAMDANDVVLLLTTFPNLTDLLLNPFPQWGTDRVHAMPMDMLPKIARLCPRLRHLGVFIDTSLDRPPSDDGLPSFPNLQRLNVGMSAIHDEHRIALYLSSILPVNCVILTEFEETLYDGYGANYFRWSKGSNTAEYKSRWRTVASSLPPLSQLRQSKGMLAGEGDDGEAAARSKISRLEMEVDELRAELARRGQSSLTLALKNWRRRSGTIMRQKLIFKR